MCAFRIGDPRGRCSVYSGEGAASNPGRWNRPGEAMIYASGHYSTAMLEKLAHIGEMPPNQNFIEILIPQGVAYEVVAKDTLPGWFESNRAAAQRFGSAWLRERRSAILLVPSVVARMERNVLINPQHHDAARVEADLETPIWWDQRLFVG